jgi:hypothetical protein
VLLIQIPDGASTSKYDLSVPFPLNLMSLGIHGDIIDLNLELRYETKQNKIERIINLASTTQGQEIILNCGEFPCDGNPNIFYETAIKYFKPQLVIGTYPTIYRDQPIPTYQNIDYSLINITQYPSYQKKLRAVMRLTQGCPNACLMCPVFKIYKGKFDWLNIQQSMENISGFYDQGVRIITLLDDNIACKLNIFKKFFLDCKKNFPKLKFHSTEGFEVTAFKDEEFCLLIKEQFIQAKIGIENIKPIFLQKINKYYKKEPELITAALANIKKYKIDCRVFLLIGLGETEQDILDNISFYAEQKMPLRINIVRNYNNKFCDKFVRDEKILKKMKALGYASSFMSSLGMNLFADFDSIMNDMKVDLKVNQGKYQITGKINYGPQTSRFEYVMKFLLEKQYNVKLKKLGTQNCLEFVRLDKKTLGLI